MNVQIRKMELGDATAVNSLSGQLGYPLSVYQTLQNMNVILQNNDHNAFVAEYDGKIVGWIGTSQVVMIEVMPHCEINGLVIDEKYRGKGIGKLLIEKVREWAKEKGNDKIRLRCNVKRTEAHLFYEHLGFVETKQQKNYEIRV